MLLEVGLTVVVLVMTLVIWTWKKSRKINIDELRITGKRRPLGGMEKAMVTIYSYYSGIAHSCIVCSKRPISKEEVKKAAVMLTERYLPLRSRIDSTDAEKLCFVPIDNFTVPMDTVKSTSWQDVIEERVMDTYNFETGPLWSLSFLPKVEYKVGVDCDVQDAEYPFQCGFVFGFHHVIIDGCSRVRLADQFLTYLDDVVKGKDTVVEPMKLQPAMEYYVADKITPGFFFHLIELVLNSLMIIPGVHQICKRILNGKKNIYIETFPIEEDANPNVVKKTCLIPMKFSREDTSKLLARCKENNASVYGAVQTSVLFAFAKLLQEGKVTETMELPISCTVNIRPLIDGIPVSDNCLGPYFLPSFLTQTIKPIENPRDDFWSMASQATNLMRNSLKGGHIFYCFNKLLLIGKLNLNKDVRFPVVSGLTSLGNCKFLERSPHSDVKFLAMHSCTSDHVPGAFFATRVITFNGQMFWTICYYTNVTTKERAEEYASLVIETLKAAIV